MRDKVDQKENYWLVRIIIILGLIILGLIVWAISRENYRKKQIQKEINALEEEAKRIQTDNSRLVEKLAYLEGRDYQEKEIRDKLNLQAPEENMVIIKPSPTDKMIKDANPNQPVDNQGLVFVKETNPQKWWNYFFKF